MGCTRCHVQPGSGTQIELLGVDRELKTSGQDLDNRGSGRLVFGELFAGVEREHGDVQPKAPVKHLGDDRTILDGHIVCGIGDQCVGHTEIMHPPPCETRICWATSVRFTSVTATV